MNDQKRNRQINNALKYRPSQKKKNRPYQNDALVAIRRFLNKVMFALLHVATGGGKTLIANNFITKWNKTHDGPVLWITKDWQLLFQAAGDLCQRNHGMRSKIARIGGDSGLLNILPESPRNASVVYSTIQTLSNRIRDQKLRGFKPSLVIWDECHWGQTGKTGRRVVRWCRRRGIPVLGLTATPRPPEYSVFETAYSKGFPELVDEGYLARPVPLRPVNTGVRWEPERTGSEGDFCQKSLKSLAKNRRRNNLIVDYYAEHQAKLGRTIVFACNINHANTLARLFNNRHGVAARPVHCYQDQNLNNQYLEQFRKGEVKVLINVVMLTTGIDVPAAKTVLLCRPTLSDVLFTQMVGRASRRIEGKQVFYIVEFTDNLSRYGDDLKTSKEFFAGTQCGCPADTQKAASPKAPQLHAFDPRGKAAHIPNNDSVDESIRGLWYRQGQTFGVELELTSHDFDPDIEPDAKWHWRATAVLDALRNTLPRGTVADAPFPTYHADNRDDSVWNVEYDNSCGWEVTSRILMDRSGYEELVLACAALEHVTEDVGLKVNYQTGMHVHLGWLGKGEEVHRALKAARLFEPAVATLVSPSRLVAFDGSSYDVTRPNDYCQPVASVFSARVLANTQSQDRLFRVAETLEARHLSFNIIPLERMHTVEVRMHNGTLKAGKIALWLSLWQQILWRAANSRSIPSVPDADVLRPSGDIVELARQHLPAGRDELFLSRIRARREEILRLWGQHPELGEVLEAPMAA